ncbi:MAG: CsgG/HfaB family protein [Phycisphaerae bacterium]
MRGRSCLILVAAVVVGFAGGCISVRLPPKVVKNPDKPKSTPSPKTKPALACDLADLPARPSEARTCLAVLDFQAGESMTEETGRALADLCRGAVQESEWFVLVDRERIADILGEQDFAAAMHCDTSSCLVRYGELLGAETMMHGRVNQLGDVLVLAVGMTDVDTGRQITKSTSMATIEQATMVVPDLVCQILHTLARETASGS